MSQKKQRSEKEAQKPPEKPLTLLLLGLGTFQIIVALLVLLLWIADIEWQSHLISIATAAVALTILLVLLIKKARA